MIYPRELFDLQFDFAERVSELAGMALEDALLDYTNFYVRLGCGRSFDAEHPTWRAYLSGLSGAGDARGWTYDFYGRAPEVSTAPPVVAMFGCFSYELRPGDTIQLHFWNATSQAVSPLARESLPARRRELSALFSDVRDRYADTTAVVGSSWLYNLERYRSLFPARFAGSGTVLDGRFRSMARWGQFVAGIGGVRRPLVDAFTKRVAAQTTLEGLRSSFPLEPLGTRGPIEEFYACYGV